MRAMQYHAGQAASCIARARLYANSIKATQRDAALIRGNFQYYGDQPDYTYAGERKALLSELRQMRAELRINQFLANLHREFC